jgi:WD40 repeat protein
VQQVGAGTDRQGDPLPPGATARLGTVRFRQNGPVVAVAFSPDGKRLASGSLNRTLHVWDPITGKELAQLDGWVDLSVTSLAWTRDGRRLLWGNDCGKVCFWGLRSDDDLDEFAGKGSGSVNLAPTPDGKGLVVTDRSGLRLLDVVTGKELRRLDRDSHEGRAPAVSPDGRRVAVPGIAPARVLLWDLTTGKRLPAFETRGYDLATVAFSPDGKCLVAGGFGALHFFDAATGKVLVVEIDQRLITSLAFAPDSKTVACGSRDHGRVVILWDVATRKPRRTLDLHEDSPLSLCFSPDGKTLAVGCAGGAVRLWDVASGKEQHADRGHTHTIHSLAYAPDGKTLASISDDGSIRLWDPHTGDLRRRLAGHRSFGYCVAFAPDGKRLASSGGHDDIRLWDAATGKQVGTLEGHHGYTPFVFFGAYGRELFSIGGNGGARLWDVARGKDLRHFAADESGWVHLLGGADSRFLTGLGTPGGPASPRDLPLARALLRLKHELRISPTVL